MHKGIYNINGYKTTSDGVVLDYINENYIENYVRSGTKMDRNTTDLSIMDNETIEDNLVTRKLPKLMRKRLKVT